MSKIKTTPHILVVDDEPYISNVLQSFLEQGGSRVTTADNGLAALHALAHDDFDLTLMDISMPLMDGLEATEFLRKCEQGQHLSLTEHQDLAHAIHLRRKGKRMPVVAVTGNLGCRKIILETGLDEYIAKPYEFKDIIRVLNQFGAHTEQQQLQEKRKHPRHVLQDFILISRKNIGKVTDISAGGLAIQYAGHDLIPDEWTATFMNKKLDISIPDLPFKLARKEKVEILPSSEVITQTVGAMFNNPDSLQQDQINRIIQKHHI